MHNVQHSSQLKQRFFYLFVKLKNTRHSQCKCEIVWPEVYELDLNWSVNANADAVCLCVQLHFIVLSFTSYIFCRMYVLCSAVHATPNEEFFFSVIFFLFCLFIYSWNSILQTSSVFMKLMKSFSKWNVFTSFSNRIWWWLCDSLLTHHYSIKSMNPFELNV